MLSELNSKLRKFAIAVISIAVISELGDDKNKVKTTKEKKPEHDYSAEEFDDIW